MLLTSTMQKFLSAQCPLHSFGIQPMSYPSIPSTHSHTLWKSFDLELENILSQLPKHNPKEDNLSTKTPQSTSSGPQSQPSASSDCATKLVPPDEHHRVAHQAPVYKGKDLVALSTYNFNPSTFFIDQMKVFDVWLLEMSPSNREHKSSFQLCYRY